MKKGVSFEALSSLDAPVSFWKGIPFGLQHVMAMFVANLAPIFLVATAAKMDAAQSAAIIQAGLLVAGLGTCLQLYGVWLIGSRLPMVTGISFTYVAAAMSIAQHQGYGAVAGAVVLGGLLEVVLGLTAKYWRRFVPPIVSAIVVTSIGFSLLSVGATSFGGGSGAKDFGSWQNLTLGLISLVACLAFQLTGRHLQIFSCNDELTHFFSFLRQFDLQICQQIHRFRQGKFRILQAAAQNVHLIACSIPEIRLEIGRASCRERV